MLSCFAPMVMALAMGQTAPAEAAWLKTVPADVVAAAHVKAIEAVNADLSKMIEAMSPNAAALSQPQLEQGVTIFSAQYTQEAVKHPMMIVARMPNENGMPPWAIYFESTDYTGVLKAVSGKDDVKPTSMGGYDSFDKADGQTWFSYKGAGFVAFGENEDLIKSIAKPEKTLDQGISAEHKASLLGGDVGLYINVAALQAKYGEQIDAARESLMGLMDQAGGQMGANVAETAKSVYAGMFDAIKVGEGLTTNLDFSAAGLTVNSYVTVKSDSQVAKTLGTVPAGPADLIARLPVDASSFVYFKLNPVTLAKIQKMAVTMVSGGNKNDPTVDQAIKMQQDAGVTETISANTVGGSSSANVGISMPKDPKKAVEAAMMLTKAMKAEGGMVKDIKITPNALTYKNFALNQAVMTFDLDKMVAPGAPGGVDAVKKMLGGDSVTSWFGTDGKIVLNVTAKDADSAKALIDATLSGKGSLGEAAAYATLRQALPKNVNALFIANAQGILKQVANQVGTMTGNEMAIPADVPKDPALFGGSMVTSPKGLSLQFTLPSNVGPVIEKGFVPLFQGMQGQIQ